MFSRRTIIPLLLLLLLTLLAYAPVLRGGWLWGDAEMLARHAALSPGQALHTFWMPPPASPALAPPGTSDILPMPAYAPLAQTLFWLEHSLWGPSPIPYHLVSIGLHVLATWLFWALLRRLGMQWSAMLGAALFAVHPLQVETVAWISQQGHLLGAVWSLLAGLFWLHWLGRRPPVNAQTVLPPRSPLTTAAALFLALITTALALLSSPLALPLPVGLLLLTWQRHGKLSRRTLLALLPHVALAAAFAFWLLSRSDTGSQTLTASQGILATFRRLLLPTGLSWIYPQTDVGPATWACWAAILGGLGITFALRRQITRAPFAGLLFFALALLSAFLFRTPAQFHFATIADHLAYIASIGLFAALAAVAGVTVRKSPRYATPILTVALIALSTLTALSARRAWQFTDAERVYRATLAQHPRTALAAELLADLLLVRQGAAAHAEAESFYVAALEAEPARTSAARSYAALLASQGRSRQAQAVLKKALGLRPADPHANVALADLVVASIGPTAYPHVQRYYETAVASAPHLGAAASRLATIYTGQSRLPEAIAVLEKTIPHNGGNASLRLQLARLYTKTEQYDRAGHQFDTACALDPKNADARAQWGDMLLASGRPQDAETQFRRALQIAPSLAAHRLRLGRALRAQGKLGSALNEFETAQELDDKAVTPFIECAQTYLMLQDEDKTEQYLQAALRVDPASADALVALGRLYLTSPDLERRNVYRGITLLRRATEVTRGEDLSVLVAYAIALGQVKEFDQALEAMDKAIALGKRLGVSDVHQELLLRNKSQLEIASAAPFEGPDNGDSRISLMGTGLDVDPERPLPPAPQRSLTDVFSRPLDLSTPPSPDDVWRPAPQGPRGGFAPLVIAPPPKPNANTTQPTRTGSSR